MNEQLQNILTFAVIISALAYTLVALRNLFKRQKDDGCSSHGCPSCGIKHEIKGTHLKKSSAHPAKQNSNNPPCNS